MDIPRCRSGNHYILVICNYATYYGPEACLFAILTLSMLLEEIVKVLSWVEIQNEKLTHQRRNFMSQLSSSTKHSKSCSERLLLMLAKTGNF